MTISENSSLLKRKDARGKAVGVRGRDGKWFGFDWIPHESTEDDLARWEQMGASVGVKVGQGLILIDADTLNEDLARIIRDMVIKHFGDKLPVRIGRYPKAGYVLRTSEPLRYTRIEFGELDANGTLKDRVEILSDGRQFVAFGVHSLTGKPYTWPRALVPFDELPIYPAASVIAFLEELRKVLPAARPLIQEGATATVDQASLKGDIELVRKAVALTPNTSAHFPTRDAYRDFGYAIKAALPDNEPAAFDIFSEWCERWQEGDNDPGIVQADWSRMHPPYRRGANWLFELAEQHAPTQFSKTEVFFQPIVEAEDPFATAPILQNALEEQPQEIKWVNPQEWHGATPPTRKWIVEGAMPDGEVTLLTGEGGVGKTLLAQQLGTCVAKGLPFLGLPTIQGNVMAFLCEDSEDELHMRQRDINAALCLDMNDLSSCLRIASRKYMDNLLVIWDRNNGAMKRAAVWRQLLADALAFKAKVIIVDTIADTFGGNEIDRSQVRQFVQSCLGRLAQEINGAVLALGHPSRAGQTSGEGTSGSTAWHASVRSRLYLTYAEKDKAGPVRKLTNMKANYGPAGDVFMLRWARGSFELVAAKQSALADGGAPGVASIADTIDVILLNAFEELARDGIATAKAKNSPYFAPRVLRATVDDLGIFEEADIAAAVSRADRAGRIKLGVISRKANRQPVIGYVVNRLVPLPVAEVGAGAGEGADGFAADAVGVFD